MTYTNEIGQTFHAVELTPNFFQLWAAAQVMINSVAQSDRYAQLSRFEKVWEKKDGDNQLFLIQEKYN